MGFGAGGLVLLLGVDFDLLGSELEGFLSDVGVAAGAEEEDSQRDLLRWEEEEGGG